MDLTESLSNHFSLRSLRRDGNTLHVNVSRRFQSAIIYLKWLMWDFGSDFPSYKVNFGELNFFGGSIHSISGAKRVWYLWSCYLGADLEVLVADLSGTMVFEATVVLATSFACKSPYSRLCLALRVWRRSTPKWIRLGGNFRLLVATVLLTLRLSILV